MADEMNEDATALIPLATLNAPNAIPAWIGCSARISHVAEDNIQLTRYIERSTDPYAGCPSETEAEHNREHKGSCQVDCECPNEETAQRTCDPGPDQWPVVCRTVRSPAKCDLFSQRSG